MRIELVKGDITTQDVDALINAANSSLMGGGGVDGAIHRKGGPTILDECRKLRDSHYGKGLPEGQAVATPAGNLPARWVIHTVGPVYSRHDDRTETLRACYRNSLTVADSLGATTLAAPLISSGIYGWPKDDAIRQAVDVLQTTPTSVTLARIMLFSDEEATLAQRLYPALVV